MTNGSVNPAVQQSPRAHSWVIFWGVFFVYPRSEWSEAFHRKKKKNRFLRSTNITMQA